MVYTYASLITQEKKSEKNFVVRADKETSKQDMFQRTRLAFAKAEAQVFQDWLASWKVSLLVSPTRCISNFHDLALQIANVI